MKKVRNLFIKCANKYKCFTRRRKIKCKDFSIISNNCWGGFIYQYFGIKYLSPTIGLFIMESDYLKLLTDIKGYMEKELVFIDPRESRFYSQVSNNGEKKINYPVARLGDVDIFFMHYSSKEEAAEKWKRRKNRINYNHMLVKLSERNDSTPEIIRSFSNLPLPNKICFTENEYDYPNCIKVEQLKELNKSSGDETPYTLLKVNIYEIINGIQVQN